MAAIFTTLISSFAPIFLIASPVTSYLDQILSIHRTRTSAGFSLDIPLIMLVASILKIFYWPGARYDLSLLIQAIVMVGVQVVLLKVSLDNRPSSVGGRARGVLGEKDTVPEHGWFGISGYRPWSFWRWRRQKIYWQFLGLMTLALVLLHLFIAPSPPPPPPPGPSTHRAFSSTSQPRPPPTLSQIYTNTLGYIGLTIEATLPIPQILSNHSAKSCRGFRSSVLLNWLIGDAMKMGFFFASRDGKVPWAFKLCGLFQAACDLGLGLQWWIYGDGSDDVKEKEKIEDRAVEMRRSNTGTGMGLGRGMNGSGANGLLGASVKGGFGAGERDARSA